MDTATARRGLALALLGLLFVTPAAAQVSGAVPRPPSPSPTPAPAARPPARKPAPKPPAAVRFSLGIEQDGAPVAIVDDEAYLRRGPFTLLIESPQADSVYLSASHDRAIYDAARQGGSLGNSFRTGIVVAETPG